MMYTMNNSADLVCLGDFSAKKQSRLSWPKGIYVLFLLSHDVVVCKKKSTAAKPHCLINVPSAIAFHINF